MIVFRWNETLKEFLKTTIIGGASFLLPMALVLFILSYALRLVKRIAEPISHSLRLDQLGAAAGVGAATVLSAVVLVLIAFAAGIVARTAVGRRITMVGKLFSRRAGIILIKFWLQVGKQEQEKRFLARINDPLRQWKLGPMDLESYRRRYDYSRARDMMLKATDSAMRRGVSCGRTIRSAPRLNCISTLLDAISYKKISRPKVKLPKRSNKGAYDHQASLRGRKFVAEKRR